VIATPIYRTIVADPPWNYRDRVGPGLEQGEIIDAEVYEDVVDDATDEATAH
jgi:hypothetical protein